jgi:hypothetical protein
MMDLDECGVEDTGFRFHVDVCVGKIGLRPGYKDRNRIKKILKEAMKGEEISSFEEKWFESPIGAIWVMGTR